MSDPLANLAKTLSPSDPQTPVPSSASPFTIGIVATVNVDGTVTANINAATAASTIYWCNASVPQTGQKIIVLGSPEGVQYAIGVVGSATDLPPMMEAYPVGAIYISTLSTNPATLMGFGTWSAFAAGRTFVGVGTSDATYTGGATGGASSRNIYAQYLPVSTPWNISDPNHNHGATSGYFAAAVTSGGGGALAAGTTVQAQVGTANAATGITVQSNSGGGQALPTMPPYVVIYAWQRVS